MGVGSGGLDCGWESLDLKGEEDVKGWNVRITLFWSLKFFSHLPKSNSSDLNSQSSSPAPDMFVHLSPGVLC